MAEDDDLLAERQQVTSQMDQLRQQVTTEINQTHEAVNTQSNMLDDLLVCNQGRRAGCASPTKLRAVSE